MSDALLQTDAANSKGKGSYLDIALGIQHLLPTVLSR